MTMLLSFEFENASRHSNRALAESGWRHEHLLQIFELLLYLARLNDARCMSCSSTYVPI